MDCVAAVDDVAQGLPGTLLTTVFAQGKLFITKD